MLLHWLPGLFPFFHSLFNLMLECEPFWCNYFYPTARIKLNFLSQSDFRWRISSFSATLDLSLSKFYKVFYFIFFLMWSMGFHKSLLCISVFNLRGCTRSWHSLMWGFTEDGWDVFHYSLYVLEPRLLEGMTVPVFVQLNLWHWRRSRKLQFDSQVMVCKGMDCDPAWHTLLFLRTST